MRDLSLDGLSEDKRFLIARDRTTGETFRVPADHRLSSLIGTPSPSGRTSGQMEITMESSLSPRDIQTRIRRGESPESVAESAGVPVERIDGFARPVLAEREFMCEQARKTTIRRKHVGGAGVLLGTLVNETISHDGGVPESAAWDSFRREDGRWTVLVTPAGAELPATFLFDVKSRYVVPADELAHDLVGDIALPESSDMAIADAVRGPSVDAPAAAEPEPELEEPQPTPTTVVTAGDVVDALVADLDLHAGVSSLKEARERRALEQLAFEETSQDAEPSTSEGEASASEQDVDEFEDSLEHDVAVPDTMGPRGKKRGERRRVPSWDEIMFGDKQD